jgi:hypothetical protein
MTRHKGLQTLIFDNKKCETTSLVNGALDFFFNQRTKGKGWHKAPSRNEYICLDFSLCYDKYWNRNHAIENLKLM